MSENIVEVPPATVGIAVAFGLARWDSKEQVYELTPKGDKYFREWIAERLEKHANQTEGAV